ncbi:hypothetical protein ACWCPX_08750, partial [Streptomyces olivaceoviridis]
GGGLRRVVRAEGGDAGRREQQQGTEDMGQAGPSWGPVPNGAGLSTRAKSAKRRGSKNGDGFRGCARVGAGRRGAMRGRRL